MRQYELAIRIAQVHHLVEEKKYKKALAVIRTLDMRQVRSLADLTVFADVYTRTEQYDAAKATYLRIYRRSRTRRVLYRLIYLSIRTNALEEAEAYYGEFVEMHPNARDALILRYRLDKASGVSIGRLIEILQELKKEEYIEEWAYELAKLYYRAGRKEECKKECEDIKLWFGSGEIVERAKLLLDHMDEESATLYDYYDDKDFTEPKAEEPNPEDTGSLPDLDAYVRENKALRREGRFAERIGRPGKNEENEEELKDKNQFEKNYAPGVSDDREDTKEWKKPPRKIQRTEEFFDEDKDFGITFIEDEKPPVTSPSDEEKPAKESVRADESLADDVEVWEFGQEVKKEETEKKDRSQREEKHDRKESLAGDVEVWEFGQEETRQRAKKEVSEKEPAAEQKIESKVRQGKEKEQSKEEKTSRESASKKGAEKRKAASKDTGANVRFSQSGTGITLDLAREISAIYEMEHGEETQTASVSDREAKENAENVFTRMEQALERVESGYALRDEEEITVDVAPEDMPPSDLEEDLLFVREMSKSAVNQGSVKSAPRSLAETGTATPAGNPEEIRAEQPAAPETSAVSATATPETAPEASAVSATAPETSAVPEAPVTENLPAPADDPIAELEQKKQQELRLLNELNPEKVGVSDTELLKRLLEEDIEAIDDIIAHTKPRNIAAVSPAADTAPAAASATVDETVFVPAEPAAASAHHEDAGSAKDFVTEKAGAKDTSDAAPVPNKEFKEQEDTVNAPAPAPKKEAETDLPDDDSVFAREEPILSALQDYEAPEIPMVETEYMEMPEISFDDLPTTRALHRSFQDILRLIEGELSPVHFVLMGEGEEKIVGLSKQIVNVMKRMNFLSEGRIAKINANRLNKMDLISFRTQLQGNCLLVEDASDLLFPTITKLFSIMEEYEGDFTVILAENSTTLDQLFRFVPSLARRFQYVIDISRYKEEDWNAQDG